MPEDRAVFISRTTESLPGSCAGVPASSGSVRGAGGKELMFPVKRLLDVVGRFGRTRVVVVGDRIADEYLYGKPARVSREAPVIILHFTGRQVKLGGAANAAHNVHALGATALAVGVLGQDAAGHEVAELFREAGIGAGGLLRVPGRP